MIGANPIRTDRREVGWTVTSVIWRLTEATTFTKFDYDLDEYVEVAYEYVETSAADLPTPAPWGEWGGPETLVFACNEAGEWISGLELVNLRGLNHGGAIGALLDKVNR